LLRHLGRANDARFDDLALDVVLVADHLDDGIYLPGQSRCSSTSIG
jgi:hypothetical protein